MQKVGVEIFLAAVFLRVQHLEKLAELWAKVGAIGGGVILNVELKGARGKNAVVFAEQTEQQTHEKLFQLVTGAARGIGAVFAFLQGVVQLAHELRCFLVRGVFGIEFVLLVSRDEKEMSDVLVEVREGKLERRREALEQGKVGVLLWLKVVDGDALEIGNDEVARRFLHPSTTGEGADVFHALRVRFAQVFARALVLREQRARPEKINVGPIAGQLFYRFLKAGDSAALDAEDVEKRIPKGFRFGILASLALPFFREGNGAVFDFIPRERHR